MHLWHHKEQQILILAFWGRVQAEGTLEGGKILANSPYHLVLLTQICSLRSVLRSVFFLDSNHRRTVCSSGSSFGLLPNWSHASPLGIAQQQLILLPPSVGHFRSQQGFLLPLSGDHLWLPHLGWLAWPLAQDEW